MIEFITKYFNFISYGFELITAIIGLLVIKRHKQSETKCFIYFLVYIVFVECIGVSFIYFRDLGFIQFLRQYGLRSNNWYNAFWMFGSVLFILKYYHLLLKTKRYKTIVKYTAVVFTLIFVLHVIFNFQLFLKVHPPLYFILDASVIYICVSLYLLELLKSNAVLNMFTSFGLYASTGLFVWWLVITPIIFYDQYNTTADWDFANLKRRVFLFANIFMYTCFAIGLIISKPHLKND